MKRLFSLVLVLPVLFLAGCSSKVAENNAPINNNIEQIPVVSNTTTTATTSVNSENVVPTEITTENKVTNKSISSDVLGVKISYYSTTTDKHLAYSATEDGNRIYFYWNDGGDYKKGQYIEMFQKPDNMDIKKIVENTFLTDYKIKSGCSFKVIEDTKNYQRFVITYADDMCKKDNNPNNDADPSWTCANCSDRQASNGISYFIYFKDQPNKYYFISVGQYSLAAVDGDNKGEWFNNIELIK